MNKRRNGKLVKLKLRRTQEQQDRKDERTVERWARRDATRKRLPNANGQESTPHLP